MHRRAWLFVAAIVVAGCAKNTGSGADQGAGHDLGGAHDLRLRADLAPRPDIAVAPDLSGVVPPTDDGGTADLASADLTGVLPPDLTMPRTGDGGAFPTYHGFTAVFTIIMENHNASSIVGSANAPFINSLIASYGLATNYMDSGKHPSLPNYLYMTCGDSLYPGVFDVDPTSKLPFGYDFPKDVDNLGHQLFIAGVPWRTYQEDANGTCVLAAAGNYAPKHDPFLYFTNIQTTNLCNDTQRDFATDFAADLAAGTYPYMWITPNLLDDGHDSAPPGDPVKALMQSDAWAMKWIPMIMSSAIYKAGGVIFLTWDEGETMNLIQTGDQVPMIVISPRIKAAGYQSNVAYTHANFLATVEDIFAVPRLGAAMGVQNMLEFFQ